jgi:hypothetical protein
MTVRFLIGNINKDEDYKFSLYTENLVNSFSNVQCHAFVLLLTKLKIILSFFDLRFWLILYNLNWRHGFQQSVMWERWNHLIVNYWSFKKLWRLCVQDHRVKTLPKTGCLLYFKQHPIRILNLLAQTTVLNFSQLSF